MAQLLPASLYGQVSAISPRLTAMGGHELSFSAGARVELGSSRAGLFAGPAIRAVAQACAGDSCSSPGGMGVELVGGARVHGRDGERLRPFLSAGVGAVYWFREESAPSRTGFDPLGEIEAGVLVDLSDRLALVMGIRGDAIHDADDRDALATFVGAVGGVTVRLR